MAKAGIFAHSRTWRAPGVPAAAGARAPSAPGLLAGGLFALEYVLLGVLLLGEHVSASFLVSAHGLLRSLFAGRRKQGTVES